MSAAHALVSCARPADHTFANHGNRFGFVHEASPKKTARDYMPSGRSATTSTEDKPLPVKRGHPTCQNAGYQQAIVADFTTHALTRLARSVNFVAQVVHNQHATTGESLRLEHSLQWE